MTSCFFVLFSLLLYPDIFLWVLPSNFLCIYSLSVSLDDMFVARFFAAAFGVVVGSTSLLDRIVQQKSPNKNPTCCHPQWPTGIMPSNTIQYLSKSLSYKWDIVATSRYATMPYCCGSSLCLSVSHSHKLCWKGLVCHQTHSMFTFTLIPLN